MVSIVNLIFFIVICGLGLRCLVISTDTFKNPFNKDQIITISGEQSLLLLTFSTGIFMIGASVSALRLFVWIALFLIAILKVRRKIYFCLPLLFYSLFLGWLLISLFFSPTKSFGIRVFLKYLYPVLVLILTMQITNSQLFYIKGLNNILKMAFFSIVVIFIFFRIPYLSTFSSELFWHPAAIMDFFPVAVAISLGLYTYLNQKKYLIYALLFIIPSIITVIRTGLIAVIISYMVFLFLKYKLKSIPYVAAFITLFVVIIIYSPDFRNKMFYKQMTTEQILEERETLSSESIDSSGRFAMWEWSLDNFYKGNELTGSGLGVLQEVFYTFKHPFGSIRIIHNDYIQLLCDTGLIGLVLYALILFSLVIHSFMMYNDKKNTQAVRFSAMVSCIAMAGMISTLYTDNVVNYSLLTLSYPFGLYGMLIGLKNKQINLQLNQSV